MTSLSDLISDNVWARLSDQLMIGCVDKLMADLHPDNEDPVYVSRPSLACGIIHHLATEGHRWRGDRLQKSSVEVLFKAVLTGEYAPNPALGRWLHQQVQRPEAARVFEFIRNPPTAITLDDLGAAYAYFSAFKSIGRIAKLQLNLQGALMAFEAMEMTEDLKLPAAFWKNYWGVFKNTAPYIYSLLGRVDLSHALETGWSNVMVWQFRSDNENKPGDDDIVQRITALTDDEQLLLLENFHSAVQRGGIYVGTVISSVCYWSEEGIQALQAILGAVEST